MAKWLPIESAPKDGAEFIGWSKSHGFVVCNWPSSDYGIGTWHFDGRSWRGASTSWARAATHWQPLPDAPK